MSRGLSVIALLFLGSAICVALPKIDLLQTGSNYSKFPGDDGDLAFGILWPEPRFVDNGDGTVTDWATGLVWLKDVRCVVGGGATSWPNAQLAVANFLANPSDYYDNPAELIKTCDGFSASTPTLAWRVPNVVELESVVSAWQNTAYFETTLVMSSTTLPLDPTKIYAAELGGAVPHLYSRTKAAQLSVMLVAGTTSGPYRMWKSGQTTCYDATSLVDCSTTTFTDGNYQAGISSQSVSRYVDNGDGTVTDIVTGLMWLKDGGCLGSVVGGQAALNKIGDLNQNPTDYQAGGNNPCVEYTASHGDWRLPNRRELFSLLHFADVASPNANTRLLSPFNKLVNISDQPVLASSMLPTDLGVAVSLATGVMSTRSSFDGPVMAVRLGVRQRVRPDATSYALGTAEMGQTTAPTTVTLTNNGTMALTITGVSFRGSDAAFFKLTDGGSCLNQELAVSASCTLALTLSPGHDGAHSADLFVHNRRIAQLTGTGKAPVVSILGQLAGEDWYLTLYSDGMLPTDYPLKVSNTGQQPLTVTSITLAEGTKRWSVVSESCTASAVAPGGGCVVVLRYTPTTIPEAETADLTISTNDPAALAALIKLDGTSAHAQATIEALTASKTTDFGNTDIGSSKSLAIRVFSRLDVPDPGTVAGRIVVSGLSIDGTNAGDFVVVSENCVSKSPLPLDLADQWADDPQWCVDLLEQAPCKSNPDGCCTGSDANVAESPCCCVVTVAFKPSAPGTRQATITIQTNDKNAPRQLTLTGEAVGVPQISAAPSPVEFGTVPLNSTTSQTLTVTNSGTAPLTLKSYSLTGGTYFSVAAAASNGCAATNQLLAPGASCGLTISFTAVTDGQQSYTLTLTSNAKDTPSLQVSLHGSGVPDAADVITPPDTEPAPDVSGVDTSDVTPQTPDANTADADSVTPTGNTDAANQAGSEVKGGGSCQAAPTSQGPAFPAVVLVIALLGLVSRRRLVLRAAVTHWRR